MILNRLKKACVIHIRKNVTIEIYSKISEILGVLGFWGNWTWLRANSSSSRARSTKR